MGYYCVSSYFDSFMDFFSKKYIYVYDDLHIKIFYTAHDTAVIQHLKVSYIIIMFIAC